MADTIRLLAALQTLLADNAIGDIGAQDMRDFLVSAIPGGRGPTFLVAATGATDARKASADFVCDGTADDVQIQAAIDALPAGGGTVMLTEGTLTVASPVQLKSGTRLIGQGRSSFNPASGTIIKAVASLDDNIIELASNAVTYFELRDFVIDGNKANQASGVGISIDWTGTSITNAPRVLLQNLMIASCKNNGMTVVQPAGMGGGVMNMIDVHAWQNDGINFDIGGSDLHAMGCVANRSGLEGWKLTGGNIQLSNCAGKGAGQVTAANGDGFLLSTGQRHQLVGCQAQDNLHDGFAISSNHHLLVGCQADSNGKTTARRNGFRIGASGDFARLIGCYAFDRNAGDARVQATGINVQAATNVMVVGCAVNNNFTVGLADTGTATILRDIEGFVTENSGTGSVLSSATTDVITHGLALTPAVEDIIVTFAEQGDNDYGRWWISSIGATQFTVNVSADPGASNLDFGWRAIVR